MINGSSSSCRNCMVLIRFIVLEGLKKNVRIFAKHVRSENNEISDALSRFWWGTFKLKQIKQGKMMEAQKTKISSEIWPIQKIWIVQAGCQHD